ncbi:MAG: peptide MFS transporter [Bacteroidetes bacterium]|nr:peptide MFS transporter [Bacteroidota bacterium]
MFKQHPRGLIVAFFANMGERFGFYTMMAILVLFLQAKYGLTADKAGSIYSWFYFAIYAMALAGGMLADATKKYKTVILVGQIIMFSGYALLAVPGLPLTITIAGLFTIALGNGLFKGNLQAVVGQMYDDPKYSKLRDSAYMVFYMGINVGAFFAPFAATGVRNWWLKTNGFLHDGSLPSLCHQQINGTLKDTTELQTLADKVNIGGHVTDLTSFAHSYIDVFARGYNYAFGIAAGAMIVSLIVYLIFSKLLPNKEKAPASEAKISNGGSLKGVIAIGIAFAVGAAIYFIGHNIDLAFAFGLFLGFVSWIVQISTKEERPRISALLLVFLVVIFFWMSFHQNGLTLTLYARDYTYKVVDAFTSLFFGLYSILSVIGAVAGVVLLVGKKNSVNLKITGGILTVAGGALSYYFYSHAGPQNAISPEVFQSFNPLFIVALTFPVMGFFNWLNNKGKEPSTPRKIGYGMIIAAIGFSLVLISSLSLIHFSPIDLGGQAVADSSRVSPYWLISTYLILTIAELCLSPMGLSFVSKVAPTRFQGLMQGGWLLATAVGNKLLFVGTWAWDRIQLWQLWAIFITVCLLSAIFIFSIMKRLENAAK